MRGCAVLAGWLLTAGLAHAAAGVGCPPMPALYKEYQTLRAQACERKVDDVEHYLAQRQRRHESGKMDDRELIAAYAAFDLPFPADFFTAWLARHPDSYSAHVAAANYEFDRGWAARGTGYSSETSKEALDAMHRHFARAQKYLSRSLTLTKMPTASYPVMISIGMHYGSKCDKRGDRLTPDRCLRAVLDKALAVDPRAYWARRFYMDSLQPRWGGNFEAMEAFANETQKAGLPDWQAKRFRAMVFEEKASVAEKPEEKLQLALQAYKLNDSSVNTYQIITALETLQRHKEILPYVNRYLEFHPGNNWALVRRGVALWLLGRNAEAYEDFVVAARFGDPFAQNKVGYFLWTGLGVPQNKSEAVRWWRRAAANGDVDGINNLKEAKAHGWSK